MKEKTHQTACGVIHYWTNAWHPGRRALVFLPGLTADHRLFDRQIERFASAYNVLTWDAPGHAASWPFALDFTLADKARWLDAILTDEGAEKPVLIGQSMGGYVAQAYAQLFPEKIGGFVSIDSAPLQRKYMAGWEIWALRHVGPVYRYYPWKALVKAGTDGVAVSAYGRALMHEMMAAYDGDQRRYAALAGHGYRMLADAVAANLPYAIPCPALLICGERDRAGSCIRYNRAWHRETGIRLEWIKDAGHNSNTDQPERVNALIEEFVRALAGEEKP